METTHKNGEFHWPVILIICRIFRFQLRFRMQIMGRVQKTGNVSGVLAIQCLFAFVISVSDWKKNFTFRSNRGNKLDCCKLAIH